MRPFIAKQGTIKKTKATKEYIDRMKLIKESQTITKNGDRIYDVKIKNI